MSGNADMSELRLSVKNHVQSMKTMFTPVTTAVDCMQFDKNVGASIPARRFEPQHVWKVRGGEHFNADVDEFVSAISSPKIGYLQAPTGSGKSTKLLLYFQKALKTNVLCISPKDQLIQLSAAYVRSKLLKSVDDQKARVVAADTWSVDQLTDVTYMSISTFFLVHLMDRQWISRSGLEVIYIDEAHYDGVLYNVLKLASFVGRFGKCSFVFTTATPPGVENVEQYRAVPVQINEVPFPSITSPVAAQFATMGISIKTMTGKIGIFAAGHEHAMRIMEYLSDLDVDLFVVTEESSTKDLYATLKQFGSSVGSTKILVTTYALEFGYTIALDKAVDFSMKQVYIYDDGVFKLKYRYTTEDEADQRGGRLGRIGDTAILYRARQGDPVSRDYVTTKLILQYAWLWLLNVTSNSSEYDTVKVLLGKVTIPKLWILVCAAAHPMMMLQYLNSDGLPYECFVPGLRVFMPRGWVFSRTDKTPYDEVTASFHKYVDHKKGYDVRIPLSSQSGFLDCMVYLDYAAKKQVDVVPVGFSLAGDAMAALDDLRSVVGRPIESHNPWDSSEDRGLAEFSQREGTVHYSDSLTGSDSEVPDANLLDTAMVRRRKASIYVPKPNLQLGLPARPKHIRAPSASDATESIYPVRDDLSLHSGDYSGAVSMLYNSRSVNPYASVMPRVQVNKPLPVPTLPQNTFLMAPTTRGYVDFPVQAVSATFRDTYAVLDTMLGRLSNFVYPWLPIPAVREEYYRPSDSDLLFVRDLVSRRERLSDSTVDQIQLRFSSLIRVWNANVVDLKQYEGHSSRSRRRYVRSGDRDRQSDRRVGGSRFETQELLVLFEAFRAYSLYPCVPQTLALASQLSTAGEFTRELTDRGVSVLRKIHGYEIVSLRTAMTVFLTDQVLNTIACVHLPRSFPRASYGVCTGAVYVYDGKVRALNHILLAEPVDADSDAISWVSPALLLHVTPDIEEPIVRRPVVGEIAFIILVNTAVTADFTIVHEATQTELRFCGPLVVRDLQPRGFWALGSAKTGMSGAVVVAASDSAVLGSLQLSDGNLVRIAYFNK